MENIPDEFELTITTEDAQGDYMDISNCGIANALKKLFPSSKIHGGGSTCEINKVVYRSNTTYYISNHKDLRKGSIKEFKMTFQKQASIIN